MTRKSKREIEQLLEDIENTEFDGYPAATLAEVLSADEVRVVKSTDNGRLLLVDDEAMAIRDDDFREFWRRDLEAGAGR